MVTEESMESVSTIGVNLESSSNQKGVSSATSDNYCINEEEEAKEEQQQGNLGSSNHPNATASGAINNNPQKIVEKKSISKNANTSPLTEKKKVTSSLCTII